MPPRRAAPQDLRVHAVIAAKPDEVYRSLTSARELCSWWADRAETAARNQGRFRMVWPSGTGCPRGEARGVFVDLEPGQKVAWLLDPKTRPAGWPALVSFFIEKKGRRSELTLIHAGFSGAAAGRSVLACARECWEDCLAKLRLYLETGRSCKDRRLPL